HSFPPTQRSRRPSQAHPELPSSPFPIQSQFRRPVSWRPLSPPIGTPFVSFAETSVPSRVGLKEFLIRTGIFFWAAGWRARGCNRDERAIKEDSYSSLSPPRPLVASHSYSNIISGKQFRDT